jgi:serine/threonine-protein kinase HipA
MTLSVYWDGGQVGRLERVVENAREFAFRYSDTPRRISLSLPLKEDSFSPAETRPFFEALLPEGAIRDQIAAQLKLASSDSFGLLAELGRDCAGALQIVEQKRMSEPPGVRWLGQDELDELITQLPHRPLGVHAEDGRLRLSLAGVQRKAVLVRDADGRYGEPLNGMPSTHILKPELQASDYPGLATNEFFCMSLAARCGLAVASVELIAAAGRPCLVVERFDRDLSRTPVRRLHQEDLTQALGLTPDFKYQHPDWRLPSYKALADLLDGYSPAPGVDRLAAARAAAFHFLVGNADAHAKNISLLHLEDGVSPAPLYDVVCTAAYAELNSDLALAIGDVLDPGAVGASDWKDFATDFGLSPNGFRQELIRLADIVSSEAEQLRDSARSEGWHDEIIQRIMGTIAARADQVRQSATGSIDT